MSAEVPSMQISARTLEQTKRDPIAHDMIVDLIDAGKIAVYHDSKEHEQ